MSNTRLANRFFLWRVDKNINEKLIKKKKKLYNFPFMSQTHNYVSKRNILCYFSVLSSDKLLLNKHCILYSIVRRYN